MTNSESKRLQVYTLKEERFMIQNITAPLTQNQEIYWQRFQTVHLEHRQWIIEQMNLFQKYTQGSNIFDAEIDSQKIIQKIQDINNFLLECVRNINTISRINCINQMIDLNLRFYKMTKNIAQKQTQLKQSAKQVLQKKYKIPILVGQIFFAITILMLNLIWANCYIFNRTRAIVYHFIPQAKEMSIISLLYNYLYPRFWIYFILIFVICYKLPMFLSIKDKRKILKQELFKLWRKTQNKAAYIQPKVPYNLRFLYIIIKYCFYSISLSLPSSIYILLNYTQLDGRYMCLVGPILKQKSLHLVNQTIFNNTFAAYLSNSTMLTN